MSIIRVTKVNGHVLQYDTDDVESSHFTTPRDVIDVTPPNARAGEHLLGQANLILTVRFRPDSRGPYWIREDGPAEPANWGQVS